jgi:tryptophanyl-tRNA synthetase
MNGIYGKDTFVVPQPFIAPIAARVMDLQNPTSKMSKSAVNENGSIFLNDTPKQIENKFKRAVTDSTNEIRFDPSEQPGVSNLLSIQSAITGRSFEELVASYAGKQYGHLKLETAALVIQELEPQQKRTAELLSDKGELTQILKKSADTARAHAARTVRRVYERIGFIL